MHARAQLIDIDECGIYLKSANRKRGKAFKSVRVRAPGPYGHDIKWTLILAIDTNGYVNHEFEPRAGTSSETFAAFITDTAAQLPPGGHQRTFMWDNLTSHKTAETYLAVQQSGHRSLDRPPYRPVDGPIEYVFAWVEQELTKRLYEIKTHADLRHHMNLILAGLQSQDALFVRLGYA